MITKKWSLSPIPNITIMIIRAVLILILVLEVIESKAGLSFSRFMDLEKSFYSQRVSIYLPIQEVAIKFIKNAQTNVNR